VDLLLRALGPGGAPLDDVFVVGDCAAGDRGDGVPHPMLAQTAIHMGAHVGANLVRRARGRTPRPFAFRSTGYIISLGQKSSVVEVFGVPLSGRLAWLAWAFAYLVKMVGFRKQLEVGLDHLTHLVFVHDSSQILARRTVLGDDELELSLRAPEADGGPLAPGGPPA
jgi:NADH:ubiquinone reductase (H+-translocating)